MTWRFEISNSIDSSLEVTPQTGVDFSIKWTKEDERRHDFKLEIKDLTFIKDDFHYFLDIEKSDQRCDLQTLDIILVCGEVETLRYTGTFSMSAGNWDLDKCTVSFKVEHLDAYRCIDENDDDVNIVGTEFIPTYSVDMGITYKLDIITYFSGDFINHEFLEDNLFSLIHEGTYSDIDFSVIWYGRHYLEVPCGYTLPDDWTLLEACDSGIEKYIKKIDYMYEPIAEPFGATGTRWVYREQYPVNILNNGMKLHDVMSYLLWISCHSGLEAQYTIVSDFFQWNPENVSDINYVTDETSKVSNLMIFQKSDVKRPNATQSATFGETNFIELLEMVCEMFNCNYKIYDDIFRIEHVSWFEDDLGIDLPSIDVSNNGVIKLLKGTKKYSYDSNKQPKYEKFKMMESENIDFVGKDIIYNNNCVKNSKDNKKERNIEIITTDILMCLENSNSDEVNDEGFVIIACDQDNNIHSADGILDSGSTPNNVLSWAHLHNDFWKHGRIFMTGEMNAQETDFLSVVPTIKQDPFDNILKCHNIRQFNPLDKIKSMLGWGYIESAELKLNQCVFNVELLFDEIQDINTNLLLGDFDDNFNDDFD